ncbi:GNAT family N-acetyltransferase [Natrinema sp. DC36]|uniref:GNAT family N-acetyltransferase n=1 Tax=Natrinema sp. DC36 TaxID=2878680 RepID=UPI001CF0455F|nr:GNAT family N-acetyltransferase [Natrinema sp. DC36]
MPGPVFLEGRRLTLRTLEPEDYEFVARHFTNPSMRHGGFEDIRNPITPKDIKQRIEEADDFHAFLAYREETPVGSAYLIDVDLEGRNAELGYWITPDEQGNGYATEAAELCLAHAFDELGLHKVWARTVEDNEGSKRVLEKLGFQQEGVLREHWLGYDRYVDEYRFGLLESER